MVGNGKGTAGLGMGKDLAPNTALMKATHAALITLTLTLTLTLALALALTLTLT